LGLHDHQHPLDVAADTAAAVVMVVSKLVAAAVVLVAAAAVGKQERPWVREQKRLG